MNWFELMRALFIPPVTYYGQGVGLFYGSLYGSFVVLILSAFLVFYRLFLGPTPYDRVLAMNCFGSLAILFLVMLSVLLAREDFLDIPMLYVLLNFVSTVAILKFFRYRSLSQKLVYSRHIYGEDS